jgi:type IV pilus assembly protein PilM
MALFSRGKTTVGLDIGSGLIKVAVIDHGKSEPELQRVSVVPLLADAIVEGEVMDPGIVADAIQRALADAGVKSTNVVIAVGGRDVIIKKIQIERVKEQQAREFWARKAAARSMPTAISSPRFSSTASRCGERS